MTKKNEMFRFLKKIFNRNLMTDFLINIFDYVGLKDYNYISRVGVSNNSVMLDVYDNISKNRFNRYCFNFDMDGETFFSKEFNNVFVTMICIRNAKDNSNKLVKLAYLFNLSCKYRIEYAKTFLDKKFIDILKEK